MNTNNDKYEVNITNDRSSTRTHPYHCIMSKRRYKEISDNIRDLVKDDEVYKQAMQCIRDVMNFDPNSSSMKPEHIEKLRLDRQRRAKEQGISIYQLLKNNSNVKKQSQQS